MNLIKKIVVCSLLAFSIFLFPACNNKKEEKDEYFLGYKNLTDENHVFQEITIQDALNDIFYKEEEFYLYIGYPTCPWCKEYISYINMVAKQNGVDKVYYINLKPYRTYTVDYENHTLPDLNPDYIALMNYLDDACDTKTFTDPEDPTNSFTVDKWIYVPYVLKIVKDDVVKTFADVPGHVRGEDGVLPPLTEEQKKVLIDGYTEIFKK